MGWQIIKQPDGKFSIWSTVSDDFLYIDCDVEDIIRFMARAEKKRITEEVNDIVKQLNEGGKPYHQFTITYEDALAYREELDESENMEH